MDRRRRWRVEYEEALAGWVERQRPSAVQIAAVVRWMSVRKSSGPPADAVPSPDPNRPDDQLTTVPGANVDVLFLAYEASSEDPVFFVRDFTSY